VRTHPLDRGQGAAEVQASVAEQEAAVLLEQLTLAGIGRILCEVPALATTKMSYVKVARVFFDARALKFYKLILMSFQQPSQESLEGKYNASV
jgi:hypothetical protein